MREKTTKGMVLIKPRRATHALLETTDRRKALVRVEDLDTLKGSPGKLTWMQMHQKEREVLGTINFDGKIEEITSDYRNKPNFN